MRGRLFLVALLVLVGLCFSEAARRKKSESKSSSKRGSNWLEEKNAIVNSKLQSQVLIPLTDSTFGDFVADSPRDYHAIVMFTATAAQYQCTVCTKAKSLLLEVAKTYMSQHDFNSSSANDRIAFFIAEVDDNRDIFGELKLETVPRILILPPTVKKQQLNLMQYEMDNRVIMDALSVFLEEISQKTGVKIVQTIDPVIPLVALCIIAALVALFVSAASGQFFDAVLWYQSPKLWIWVSMICFGVGVSGSIFCVIRSAPLYGITRQGMKIFAPQGRDQYLVEGIIVALWTLGCGVAGAIVYSAPKLPFALLRHVAVILAMSIMVVLLFQIWHAYVDKTGWYSLKETLPAEVWTWFASSIKKSSTLSKRLVRLSEFWLFEAKDFESLQKKGKLLVFDYLKRFVFPDGK